MTLAAARAAAATGAFAEPAPYIGVWDSPRVGDGPAGSACRHQARVAASTLMISNLWKSWKSPVARRRREMAEVAPDERVAVQLCRLAADRGNAVAQCSLGVLRQYGRGGLRQNDYEAARLYKLAAHQGLAQAQSNLGVFYQHGRGDLPQDDYEAARLFKLAADQGNAAAQQNLGVLYAQGRGGLPQDEREAARLCKLAADQGFAQAQSNLAFLYEHGRCGLPQDEREAARLFKLAADQGNAAARRSLEALRQQGRGGEPKDDRLAERARTIAADRERAKARAAFSENRGAFSRLFGQRADTRDAWREQHEDRERRRRAAERQSQRRQEEPGRRRGVASGALSAAQAFDILGLRSGANEEEIDAAYRRLIKRMHPDVGGSSVLAKQLNVARDALRK